MRATGSAGADDISMGLIKQAITELEPLLLHLVNSIIKSREISRSTENCKNGTYTENRQGLYIS